MDDLTTHRQTTVLNLSSAHISFLWTASFGSSRFFFLRSKEEFLNGLKEIKKEKIWGRFFYSRGSHISVMVVNAR